MQERDGIPKFDLAEQIMAEHRKNASVMRKGPSKASQPLKRQPKLNPVVHAVMLQSVSLGQEQVIADIVARDIEMLCRRSV